MDTITEQLLAIEGEARAAMHSIEKENAQLSDKAEEALGQKIARLELEGEKRITQFIIEAEKDTAARIARIHEEYCIKSKTFIADEDAQRGKIFHDVLYANL
ncbi:MAG: hypothetical protein FWF79_03475 [Defluviitaleaceae bacterium]|nr:hypothetical protein [Defluviitaleaceae bacterium]